MPRKPYCMQDRYHSMLIRLSLLHYKTRTYSLKHCYNMQKYVVYGRVCIIIIYRGVARDKSMFRYHYSIGNRGHAPSDNFDILYRRSCILEHFKASFKGFFLYFAAFVKTKNIIILNVNSSPKI